MSLNTTSSSPKKDIFKSSGERIVYTEQLIFQLLPCLIPPEKLLHHHQINHHGSEREGLQEAINPVLKIQEILSVFVNDINLIKEKSLQQQKLYELLTQLYNSYTEFVSNNNLEQSPCEAKYPALLMGTKLGFYELKQATARNLLGIDSNGQRLINPYLGASHYVIKMGEVHYKLNSERPDYGLATGREKFVAKGVKTDVSQKTSSLFLTAASLVAISDIRVNDNDQKAIHFINASLTVEGVSLYDWLIIKQLADVIKHAFEEENQGKKALKQAIAQWISNDYVISKRAEAKSDEYYAETLYQTLALAQAALPIGQRLLDFEMSKGVVSNRIEGVCKQLLTQEGIERFEQVCAFIPEISGRN